MELKYGKPALDYSANFAISIGKLLKIFLPYQSLTRKEREAAAVMKTRQPGLPDFRKRNITNSAEKDYKWLHCYEAACKNRGGGGFTG